MTAVATPLSPSVTLAPRTRSGLARLGHYVRASIGAVVREWSFLTFIIALPTVMYLFFAGIYGQQMTDAGVQVNAIMMVTMATYGGLGAAMNAGATIQAERSSGWFRQLMLTPLRPAEFFAAKVVTAIVVLVPAIAAVFVAGTVMGVRLPVTTWLERTLVTTDTASTAPRSTRGPSACRGGGAAWPRGRATSCPARCSSSSRCSSPRAGRRGFGPAPSPAASRSWCSSSERR